ncbi:MAG: nucleotidyltransferase family protein [Candidatus Eisenbacteria bacterium]|nr:nucleotidyltransferase family protein [Candidatus Eisenbacteria bacterium]
MSPRIPLDRERIAELCHRYRISELSLFGSVLREDFGPDSDVDVLVEFDAGADVSLTDLIAVQDELALLLGRPVDVVDKRGLRNPFRRHAILTTRQVVYAA